MKGSNRHYRSHGKKKPTSSSGAKLSSANSGRSGKGSSQYRYERPHANNAVSRRSGLQAKANQRAQRASVPAEQKDNNPAKSAILMSNWWGALIGLAAIAYFIYQTITVGFDYVSLFLTFAGLSVAAWFAVAWLALQFARLNWLIIVYLPATTTITLGLAAMSQPQSVVFFNAPMSAARGVCTGSPAGWVFHAFRPGQCAGVAFGRLSLFLAGGVATLIMAAINRSVKWRVRYVLDTVGRRRFMRNERRAWEFAHRKQTKEELDQLKQEIGSLKSNLKTYSQDSGEAARIRSEIQQLRVEYDNKFLALLHDIHIYRKERRNERRQRRGQWHFKYWLGLHPNYAAVLNSMRSDSSAPAKSVGTTSKAQESAGRSSAPPPSSKVVSGPKIFHGPVKQRSRFKAYSAFRYCVKHWTKHYDIYVYIHEAAPKRIRKTAGRPALETVLKRGEAPNRIFIDSAGKIITQPFSSDWHPN